MKLHYIAYTCLMLGGLNLMAAEQARRVTSPFDVDAEFAHVADIVRRTPLRGATVAEQLNSSAIDLELIQQEVVAIPNNPQKLMLCGVALGNIQRNIDRLRLKQLQPSRLKEADAEKRAKLLAQAERLKVGVEKERSIAEALDVSERDLDQIQREEVSAILNTSNIQQKLDMCCVTLGNIQGNLDRLNEIQQHRLSLVDANRHEQLLAKAEQLKRTTDRLRQEAERLRQEAERNYKIAMERLAKRVVGSAVATVVIVAAVIYYFKWLKPAVIAS